MYVYINIIKYIYIYINILKDVHTLYCRLLSILYLYTPH